jgi:hypothetical protein
MIRWTGRARPPGAPKIMADGSAIRPYQFQL